MMMYRFYFFKFPRPETASFSKVSGRNRAIKMLLIIHLLYYFFSNSLNSLDILSE